MNTNGWTTSCCFGGVEGVGVDGMFECSFFSFSFSFSFFSRLRMDLTWDMVRLLSFHKSRNKSKTFNCKMSRYII